MRIWEGRHLADLDRLVPALTVAAPEAAKVVEDVVKRLQHLVEEIDTWDDEGPDWKKLHDKAMNLMADFRLGKIARIVCPACIEIFWDRHRFHTHFEATHDYQHGECGPEVTAKHIGRVDAAAEACLRSIAVASETIAGLRARDSRERPSAGVVDGNVFRRLGKKWQMVFDGKEIAPNHSKSFSNWTRLLANPRTDILAGEVEGKVPTAAGSDVEDAVGKGDLSNTPGTAASGEAESERATREALREALEEFAERRQTLLNLGNEAGAADVEKEEEQLLRAHGKGYGLKGRERDQSSPAEKARKRVGNSLRSGIDRIGEEHPALAEHLRSSLQERGGTFGYHPLKDVEWTVD
jgi:hypothetical protein